MKKQISLNAIRRRSTALGGRSGGGEAGAATKPSLPPSDWVQPWWLRRQRDIESAAYHPTSGPTTNAVGRTWTLVGNLDGAERMAVDRRGLVAVSPGSWSLDWWVRGEDWVFPSHEAGMRQRLVDQAPVVETIVRVGGGDIIHRCYGARLTDEYVVIELENTSSTPVAVGLAVRPYDLTGPGRVGRVEVSDNVVTVDGIPAFAANRAPGQLIVGSGGVDAAANLAEDMAAGTEVNSVECAQGRANAVAVYPLVHSTTLRVAIPLSRGAALTAEAIDSLPEAARVVRGWRFVTENAARVVLPAGRLDEGFDAARRQLLLHHFGDDVVASPLGAPPAVGEDDCVLAALSTLGQHDEVRQVLIGRGQMQDPRGAVLDGHDRDLTGTSLVAAGRHLTYVKDPEIAQALSEFAADGSRWLLAASGDAWADAGLRGAYEVLLAGGHTAPAAELLAATATRPASPAATPPTQLALALSRADDSAMTAVGERARMMSGAAVAVLDSEGPVGFDPVLTVAAALADPDLARRASVLEWLLEQASPTWAWPTAIHPKLGTGTAGVGQDGRVTAGFVQLVMSLLVAATRGDRPTVEVARHWLPAWVGQGVEVHNAPTVVGDVSWAIRWHGERPALLWEIVPHDPDGPQPLITAAGLDENFSADTWVGESLLAAWPIEAEPEDATPVASEPVSMIGRKVNIKAPFTPPPGGGSFS
jgi:hypothetical protein